MTITDEMVDAAAIACAESAWAGSWTKYASESGRDALREHMRAALEAAAPAIRKAALEEAAKIAKGAWLSCPYGELADVNAMWALSEYTEAAIRTLAGKEGAP